MKKIMRFATAVLVAFCLFGEAALAQDDFDYKIDRVVITVNSVVVLDDNFGDEALGPWTEVFGTIEDEADGYLHLKSPGTLVPFRGIDFNRSDARWTTSLSAADSWTLESYWEIDPLADDLDLGRSFGATLIGTPNDINFVGIINYDSESSALLGISPSGLVAFAAHTTTGLEDIDFGDPVSIAPGNVTGQVVKEISHVGGTSTIEMRISLDGGSTYIDFGSFPITVSTFVFDLYADPVEGQVGPSPNSYLCTKVKDLKNPRFTKQNDIPFVNIIQSGLMDTKRIFVVCPPTNVGGGIEDLGNWICGYKVRASKLAVQPEFEVVGVTAGTSQVQAKKWFLFFEPCPDPTALP